MRALRGGLVLALLAGLLAGACSRDDEVKKAVSELDEFTNELVGKVTAAPSPSAGFDAAQKYLDGRRSEIRGRLAILKTVRGFQISKETRSQIEESLKKDVLSVAGLGLRYVGPMALDPGLKAKWEKLTEDYKQLITR